MFRIVPDQVAGSVVKNICLYAGDMGLIPGLGRTPGEGNGNPLQYCLGNHGVAEESATT